MLFVNDIFLSIQGESSFAGYPCNFIRLSGCNLNCTYCDTKESLKIENSRQFTIDEIIGIIKKQGSGITLAEVTGGEPLIQEDVYGLFNELKSNGFRVLLETNGTVNLKKVPSQIIKVVDVKCPSSGFSERFDFNNLEYINPSDEIKFVIGCAEDYDFAKQFLYANNINTEKIIFSPVEGLCSPKTLAGLILNDRLNVRLGLQLHKILNIK